MTLLKKIISGGQTGADQGGLYVAHELGLTTGGWMPKFYLTDDGLRPDLAEAFGLEEHKLASYPPRTEANVKDSDGTLVFGRSTSSGSQLTIRYCREHHKPCFQQYWVFGHDWRDQPAKFRAWLQIHRIVTLNVAGNRESQNPGIYLAVGLFLKASLRG